MTPNTVSVWNGGSTFPLGALAHDPSLVRHMLPCVLIEFTWYFRFSGLHSPRATPGRSLPVHPAAEAGLSK
jgi:hypothetical protein